MALGIWGQRLGFEGGLAFQGTTTGYLYEERLEGHVVPRQVERRQFLDG